MDYAQAIRFMMKKKEPDDYVIGTGETHTVRQFLSLAFEHVGLNWQDWVTIDESLKRPSEVNILRADYRKARERLSWMPTTRFESLVREMVDHDLEIA